MCLGRGRYDGGEERPSLEISFMCLCSLLHYALSGVKRVPCSVCLHVDLCRCLMTCVVPCSLPIPTAGANDPHNFNLSLAPGSEANPFSIYLSLVLLCHCFLNK